MGRHITIKEQSMAKDGRRVKGRQILNLVYDYTIEDVLHVELKGDRLAKLKSDLGRYHHWP